MATKPPYNYYISGHQILFSQIERVRSISVSNIVCAVVGGMFGIAKEREMKKKIKNMLIFILVGIFIVPLAAIVTLHVGEIEDES